MYLVLTTEADFESRSFIFNLGANIPMKRGLLLIATFLSDPFGSGGSLWIHCLIVSLRTLNRWDLTDSICETLMFMCEYCSTRGGKECDVCLGVIVCELHTQIHEQSHEHKYNLRRILKLQLPMDTKSS